MNYLTTPGIIVTLLLLTEWTWDPLAVTHKYGHLPKVYIETPVEDLRFRVYNLDTINLRLKKKFN
jgi:hypothetical protein